MNKCENCYLNKVCIKGASYRTAKDCKLYIATADVQKIVRCKDCDYNGCCSVQEYAGLELDDFCSRGVQSGRKGGKIIGNIWGGDEE